MRVFHNKVIDPLLQADQPVEGEDVFQERKERRRKGQEEATS